MRAVLDTNVWISGLLYPNGTCGHVLRAVRQRAFVVVAYWPLAEEISEVLGRPRIQRRYGVRGAELHELLEIMKPLLPMVEMETPLRGPDSPVLTAAIARRAEIIVSGDQDLHDKPVRVWLSERRIEVLTPRDFLNRLAEPETRAGAPV